MAPPVGFGGPPDGATPGSGFGGFPANLWGGFTPGTSRAPRRDTKEKDTDPCPPWGGKGVTERVRYDSGVVSLDVHEETGLALAGCMDGTVSLLDASSELTELHRWRLHKKYAHCVRWHPSGRMFASCSFDHTVCIFRDDAAEGTAAASISISKLHAISCGGVAESICWTPDGGRLVVAARGAAQAEEECNDRNGESTHGQSTVAR